MAGEARLGLAPGLFFVQFINGFQYGLLLFLIASGLQILGIGASFWDLVPGVLVSLIFEVRDFEFTIERPLVGKRLLRRKVG